MTDITDKVIRCCIDRVTESTVLQQYLDKVQSTHQRCGSDSVSRQVFLEQFLILVNAVNKEYDPVYSCHWHLPHTDLHSGG